jgi:hypothetical protein
MLQFAGGPGYPTAVIMLILAVLAAVGLYIVHTYSHPSVVALVALALGMLGGILMVSAFTPVGLVPPQGGFRDRLRWFFIPQQGTSVQLNQPMLYIGLVLVFAAQVLSLVAN